MENGLGMHEKNCMVGEKKIALWIEKNNACAWVNSKKGENKLGAFTTPGIVFYRFCFRSTL